MSNDSNLLTNAVNTKQYDEQSEYWKKEGNGANSASRLNLWHYIEPYFSNLNNKKVLDIGAGTGWLSNLALEYGASYARAIEPSIENVSISKQLYPQVKVHHGILDTFKINEKFDLVLAVMVLTHIEDLDRFFELVGKLTGKNAECLFVVPDFEYFKMPRFDYVIDIESLSDDSYVVSITREDGTIIDIVRKNNAYIEDAKKHGFDLMESRGLPPSKILIEMNPKYKEYRDFFMFQLLRFKKV